MYGEKFESDLNFFYLVCLVSPVFFLSKMSVVNVKVQHIRPLGYKTLEEWVQNTNNIYIGRAGVVFVEKQRYPKKASVFCNPYKVGKVGTREEVLLKYEAYMRERIAKEPVLVEELRSLKGKTLGCWCKPEGCHGDVLLRLIGELT